MCRRIQTLLLAAFAVLLVPEVATPRDRVGGPVEATVIRVIDGDTVEVDAHVWPGHTVRVAVRLRGVDAPELRSRCRAEKVRAREARRVLDDLLRGGVVFVSNVDADKYFGRVVGDLTTTEGVAVSQALLGASVVAAYEGGARSAWC